MALKTASTTSFAAPVGHVSIRFTMMHGKFAYVLLGKTALEFNGKCLVVMHRAPMYAMDMFDLGHCERSIGMVLALYSQWELESPHPTWAWHLTYLVRQMNLPDSQMNELARIINMYKYR